MVDEFEVCRTVTGDRTGGIEFEELETDAGGVDDAIGGDGGVGDIGLGVAADTAGSVVEFFGDEDKSGRADAGGSRFFNEAVPELEAPKRLKAAE